MVASIALAASLGAQRGAVAPQGAVVPQRGWKIVRADLEVIIEAAAAKMVVVGTLRLKLEGAESSPGPTIGLNARRKLMRFVEAEVAGGEV